MTAGLITYRGGPVFDGEILHHGVAVQVRDGRVVAFGPDGDVTGGQDVALGQDVLSPGYVDLQVNGGDGVMFNDAPTVETLNRIAQAHNGLGATTILPTLITDTAEQTAAAIKAATDAIVTGVAGIGGLHLEGPHLSIARKGAHDPDLIRPMDDIDLENLCDAAQTLPALLLTIAPENVTLDQVDTLSKAGAILSLGHTDADFDTCMTYAAAGVTSATHLFNAMRQLGNREPGVVGAVLANPNLSSGLIADGIHVHPESMRTALAAKQGPSEIFLVSDAMAVAGSEQTEFTLNGRTIQRRKGRLTLADGTLAGADLDLTTAIRVLVQKVGVPLDHALRMATSVPAHVAGLGNELGRIALGAKVPLIRISQDLTGCKPLS
ncbi:MAG: N-acetylglucosamine-6-phosphate deacetylase [Paracoccaceae bacterium]